MATIDTHISERRHIPDRRANKSGALAKRMTALDWISMALLTIGGLNWGLVGLFNFDLVAQIFGEMSLLSRIIYTLVGLSALYSIYTSKKLSSSRG